MDNILANGHVYRHQGSSNASVTSPLKRLALLINGYSPYLFQYNGVSPIKYHLKYIISVFQWGTKPQLTPSALSNYGLSPIVLKGCIKVIL